jgi:cyclopropane-fatty-acyl-phospholipid synthase
LTPSGRVVLANLGNLRLGDLRVVWCDGSDHDYHSGEPGPRGEIVIRDPAAARRMVLGGSIGFAEGYLDGTWTTPDLVALLELLSANIVARGRHHRSPLRPMQTIVHRLRLNTRRGARKNIAYHYDLGNDFYRLWLDPTLTYSCGLFAGAAAADPVVALEQAQRAKWDRLLTLIDPLPGSSLLDIGCGWGGFAIHAAQRYDCHVIGITLSEEQLALAIERAREAGLADRVRFRLQDYRDVRDTFDHVASIEMFEAVGETYWPHFFRQLRACLRPGGRAGLQVITIDDDRFEAYRTRADFIQKYVFPGGMLPSPRVFGTEAAAAGLAMETPDFFAASYDTTLSCWLDRFDAVQGQVAALGFDDRFIRMWRYYLAYCIAGFRNGMIDLMQVALT